MEDPLYPDNALQYVLRLNAVDEYGTHREAAKFHFDNAHATTFTVSDLKPDQLYSLQLSYLDTEKRWSPESAAIRFRTMPQLQVVVLDVGEGFCSLQWGRWSNGNALPMDRSAYKIVLQDVAAKDAVPIQFHVQDKTTYTVPNLSPNTLYRVQVAASPKGSVEWGVWSEDIYVCTTAPMEADLELVGEDYCQITWQRLPRDNILSVLPDPRLMTVCWDEKATKPIASSPDTLPNRDGHVVFVGEDAVHEYHVQLFSMNPDALPGEGDKTLQFETKLSNQHSALRVPGLTANTEYEAYLCASVASREWGCWSNALRFKTSMPTEVRVGSITQDCVTIVWGKGGEDVRQDANVLRYQLRIQGIDDEYLLEVEKNADCHSYEVKGLNINSCYAVAVRSFLKTEMEWTPFCHKIYVVLKVVAVEVLETSQDWAHLQWYNKVAPDNRPKVQFLTLLGDNTATTVTLGAAAKSYIFPNLAPAALYTAHLLSVEESGGYVKVPQTASQQNYSRASTTSSATNFSIPLVAADFSTYLADGHVFRTHRSLDLSLDRVGQNFVLIRWMAQSEHETEGGSSALDANFSNELFEVEVIDIDGDAKEPKLLRTQGNYMFVRQLAPSSTVRCSVRWVAKHSEATCKWSDPVVARLLPMIEPALGAGDGTEVPGVGEDYLLVHWDSSLRNSNFESSNSLTFDVRLMPLEGPDAHKEQVFETKQPSFHFSSLRPDTKFQIQIRTVIAHQGVVSETIRGDWSKPLICTTLSPMAVAVTDVVEVGAVVHWRRKNCAVGTGWWEDVPPEILQQEIATISSFHVRAMTVLPEGDSGESVTVFDEQFGERHPEYISCWAKLKALKPGGTYAVSVRASTGMLWGAWSSPVEFTTQLPVSVCVPCVGDSWMVAEWSRTSQTPEEENKEAAPQQPPSADKERSGSIVHWELSFCTVGTEKEKSRVIVDCSEARHCVGGLNCNRPYTICVRPCYKDEEYGPWSIPLYFVTLAPLKVDVGKVGETFVQVSWERETQRTIANVMRYKHLDSVKALDAELREYEEQLQELRAVGDDDIPVDEDLPTAEETAVSMSQLLDDTQAPKAKRSTLSVTKADTERYLMDQIEATRQRAEKERKLVAMQVAELERTAVYAKGDDLKYELIVHGGNPESDSNQPFLFKKKLGRGELLCRLENLTPKSLYRVQVRSSNASNYDTHNIAMTHVEDVDVEHNVPWGSWSEWSSFVTLKPISISTNGIGSECISVEWDTGLTNESSSSRTAITRFQIHLVKKLPGAEQAPDITLEDPSLTGHVVTGLQPNIQYSVGVRVCYEGDKWGVWSAPIHFITMPKLLSKLESVAERQIELLIWRDQQLPVPESQGIVVWNPLVTEHQLAINGTPCAHSFVLEQGTSTLLTLDTLSVDTEYTVTSRDKVVGYWQAFQPILQSETIPFAPLRATLHERKGPNVVIAWKHKQNLSRQYIYMVEMAVVVETEVGARTSQRTVRRGPGTFQLLGFTLAQDYSMEIPYAVHDCYFRVKTCKTNQTIDGEPHPIIANPQHPQSIIVDSPHVYVWSTCSPTANFKTPSLPDHPTQIHVTNLTHNGAILRWAKPANHAEHCDILYRVFLNNSYLDQFTCVCETSSTVAPLNDLIPNCHYRVSVTAESTMGKSMHNNTLHFSTPFQGEGSDSTLR